jgi:hypothetical protein
MSSILFYSNSLTRPSALSISHKKKQKQKWNCLANWSIPFFSSSQFLFYLFSFGNGTFKRGPEDKILSLSFVCFFFFFYINKQMIKNAIRKGRGLMTLENRK